LGAVPWAKAVVGKPLHSAMRAINSVRTTRLEQDIREPIYRRGIDSKFLLEKKDLNVLESLTILGSDDESEILGRSGTGRIAAR
jgi:hypothetical protein